MDQNVRGLAERLLQRGYEDLPDREKRVLRQVAKRVAISQNVNERFSEKLTFGQWLADRVAAFGGSWSFIILFFVVLMLWVVLNTVWLSASEVFDPYPFVFLNLVLSMLAAIQAPVIMMSQNRQAQKDRLAATYDYEVNLKAEVEIMNLHEKLDDVRMRQLETLLRLQGEQMQCLNDLLRKSGATAARESDGQD
ncbi:putative membrane protein [Amorphus suaedae]